MLLLVSSIDQSGGGGIEMVNRLIMESCRANGIAAAVIALTNRQNTDWLAEWPGSAVANGSRLRYAFAALKSKRFARESVILATHVSLVPVARLVKSVTNCRIAAFLHGVECWSRLPRLTQWGMRRCDQVVSNSHFTLSEFRKANQEYKGLRSDTCYLPARPLGNSPVAETLHKRCRRVLIVGRLWGRGMRKGQRELIAIWPRITSEFPDAELCIVGRGDGRIELSEMAKSHGVSEQVKFLGEVSDAELNELYASSAFYAMPSWGEGFGLVFAEAMAHGLPCIASRFDAGGEVVVDGETGFVVDPQNPNELYDRVRRFLVDEDLCQRMGRAAKSRAENFFGLERFQKEIIRIVNGA